MYRAIIFLLLALTGFYAHAQLPAHLSNNSKDTLFYNSLPAPLAKYKLDDLQKAGDSLSVRIWLDNEIIEVRKQHGTASTTLINWIDHQKPVTKTTKFDNEVSLKLLDSFTVNHVLTLPGSQFSGLDGSFVTIEVAMPQLYRSYHYWSPSVSPAEGAANVAKILRAIDDIVDLPARRTSFIESLEPGTYPWGMIGLRVDRLLADTEHKSSLYTNVEKRIRAELNITGQTSHQNFPTIFINRRASFLRDLNKYDNADVKSISIITKPGSQAIYGRLGQNGVVLVEVK